jgi:uncharacterized protein YdeI (YjbR/CyaY-like superfamily)
MLAPPDVDTYLRDGCGRCDRFQTPACKVHRWAEVLAALRELVIGSKLGLTEEVRWGSPCYLLGGEQVVLVGALERGCVLSFVRGSELSDPDGALAAAGPQSRLARVMRFASKAEVVARAEPVGRLLAEAVALARSGPPKRRGAAARERAAAPPELAQLLEADSELRRAFEALTLGRQRSHVLHVLGAKQPATRARRAEQCVADIVAGRGFRERRAR